MRPAVASCSLGYRARVMSYRPILLTIKRPESHRLSAGPRSGRRSCRRLATLIATLSDLPEGAHDALTTSGDCLDGLLTIPSPAGYVAKAVRAAVDVDAVAHEEGNRLCLQLRVFTRARKALAMEDGVRQFVR